jgi:mycothiol synthase
MLMIRQFVKGVDEPVWVEVLNAAFEEFKDWRTINIEQFLLEEKNPNFDPEGRLIAELDEKPVGVIHAHVDKSGKEKKGFIQDFGVIPKFRGFGVEEKLVESAVNELKKLRTKTIQAPRIRWPHYGSEEDIQFFERMGFELTRKISLMEIDLANIPSNVGENTNVVISALRKNVDEDIEMLGLLRNECSKGQFNYHPTTVEETRYFVLNNPFSDMQLFFAVLGERKVGVLVVVVDEKYNIEKNVKAGAIIAIGVLPSYRRRGIGTRLNLLGLKVLKEKGMTKAMLDVDDFNQTKAKQLYEKVGFEVVEQYLTYEKRLEL